MRTTKMIKMQPLLLNEHILVWETEVNSTLARSNTGVISHMDLLST